MVSLSIIINLIIHTVVIIMLITFVVIIIITLMMDTIHQSRHPPQVDTYPPDNEFR